MLLGIYDMEISLFQNSLVVLVSFCLQLYIDCTYERTYVKLYV